ncbi:M48 family metallopeptidase, partial [uncultured Planktosalinus sp.]|uniref:M48 family metallopeptidase n=1 Tax=uncultured Planktosalinus sp. TaxID=1810935 RepID=UPI0030DA2980
MEPNTLFYILIGLLTISFITDKWLSHLNAKNFDKPIPDELKDVYDEKEYEKSQDYKKVNYKFGLLSSTVMFIITMLFFFLDGFAFVDAVAREFSSNNIVVALLFFGILFFASDLISTPFSYFDTFVIEEQFGFNKSTKKLFFIDKIKGWLLTAVLGGGILALIIWFYETTGPNFWLYGWLIITVFSVFMNMFYARLIVPLFNKQSPLEDGSLRNKIEEYAKNVGFKLDNIFVIDSSKRSTKANAYFSGFGKEKRITLYDTLIKDLNEDEIVAVLAHEVGHYKRNHIIVNLFSSIVLTGLTLWLLSIFIDSPLLSQALGVETPSFHIGLIAFFILYSPISTITGLVMTYLSRVFEYQ